jgi:spermidine/putrescine transport system substrate-binding protein
VSYQLVRPLERARLPHWDDLSPSLRESAALAGPEGRVLGVPYMFGATGLGIRTDLMPAALAHDNSWHILWSPELRGRVAINARLLGVLVVLLEQGIDFTTFITTDLPQKTAVYAKVLGRARQLRANVLKTWNSGNDVQDLLRSGQVVAADIWDGPGRQLALPGAAVRFSLPQEGAVGWCDLWVVSSGSRNVDAAYRFLNYLERADVVERVVTKSWYSRANRTAMMQLPPAVRDRAMYTDDQIPRIKHLPSVPPDLQRLIDAFVEDIALSR